MAPVQSRFRVPEKILVALSEGPRPVSELVFELDYKPSSVYSALSTLVAVSHVEKRPQPGGRSLYNLTPEGLALVERLDNPKSTRARPNTLKVERAIAAGYCTTEAITKITELKRWQVYSALMNGMKRGRIGRSDRWGIGSRGNGVVAEYVLLCQ
jgi:DNA-binding MarR family transcriptional regulator